MARLSRVVVKDYLCNGSKILTLMISPGGHTIRHDQEEGASRAASNYRNSQMFKVIDLHYSTEYYRGTINGFKVSTALHQTYNPIHIRRASSVIYVEDVTVHSE